MPFSPTVCMRSKSSFSPWKKETFFHRVDMSLMGCNHAMYIVPSQAFSRHGTSHALCLVLLAQLAFEVSSKTCVCFTVQRFMNAHTCMFTCPDMWLVTWVLHGLYLPQLVKNAFKVGREACRFEAMSMCVAFCCKSNVFFSRCEIRQNTPKYVIKSTYSALYLCIEHTLTWIQYVGPRILAYFAPLALCNVLL